MRNYWCLEHQGVKVSKHTIYKYPLPQRDMVIDLPQGADPVHVGTQGKAIILWVRVTTDVPSEPRTFHVRGTGEDIDITWVYIGTVEDTNNLIWHVFEEYPTNIA